MHAGVSHSLPSFDQKPTAVGQAPVNAVSRRRRCPKASIDRGLSDSHPLTIETDGWRSLTSSLPNRDLRIAIRVAAAKARHHARILAIADQRRENDRGEPAWGARHRAATLYSVGPAWGPDHEAAMRFGGEAAGRRAHSHHGMKTKGILGSPPPRTVVSDLPRERFRTPKLCL